MTPTALVTALWVWQSLQPQVWLILIGTGSTTVVGHLALFKANTSANAVIYCLGRLRKTAYCHIVWVVIIW